MGKLLSLVILVLDILAVIDCAKSDKPNGWAKGAVDCVDYSCSGYWSCGLLSGWQEEIKAANT